MRMLGLVALAILTLGIGSYFSHNILPSVIPVRAASRTIALVGYFPYWNSTDPTIIVTKGDSVTVVASATDSASHKLWIDLDGDGVSDTSDCGTNDQCSGTVTSTSPSTIPAFTVNTVGNFSYYCTVHYPYMTGTFAVQKPAVPPSPDIGIAANPTALTLSPGDTKTTTVTLTSVNGFSGKPSLSASVAPSGPQVTISPATITLTGGGSATATLTVVTSGSGAYSTPTTSGSYTVTVTATNSSLSRSTTVSVTVGSSPPSGNSSLSIGLIAGGVIAAVAIIGVVAYLLRRKPTGTP